MESRALEAQLKALPTKPGVYLFKDAEDRVLYVGKAASLHHRVRSYFGPPHTLSPKLNRMMAKVRNFEFLVTDSEQEAILLECNLIKRHRPRYNVHLKDDKTYPYLKISLNEDWPRVYITRRLERDGARYFGPFASAGSVRKTLNLLKKLFPFRSCKKPITGTDTRPCLEYHIHRCLGPCIGAVSKEEYRRVIEQVILFLEGKQEMLVGELQNEMEKAAENLEFEKASILRDQIQAVERVTERQKISSPTPLEEDVIALAEEGDRAYVEVFLIRSGRLIGREHFILEGSRDEEPGEIMSGFVKQFYDSAPYIPPLILLQHPVNEVELVEGWLGSRRGGRVELRVPHRGEKRKLMEMVAGNAREGLEQMKLEWMADSGKISAALEELRDKLDLPHLPLRMECYDISNIGGTSAVGSMVVFENGKSRVSHYRRFKIKTVAATDDCAMLREVLRRRFKRNAKHVSAPVSKSGEKTSVASETIWTIIPDLILIDGGKGQLNASLEALQEVGIEPVPIASLAKQNEEVFVPNRTQPIILPRSSPALFLLQRIRDEAHRFALSYHVKVRRKTMLTSNLDEIPGIGPRRKRALIKRFGSVRAIREASAEELAVVENMTRPAAERVKEYLQSGCSSSCS